MSTNSLHLYSVYIVLACFIAWQFYVCAKYHIGFPKIRIDNKNEKIIVGKQTYNFSDIKLIRIIPITNLPTVVEKALSKCVKYVNLSNIELYMKNNSLIQFKSNSKKAITEIMTNVEVEINYDEQPYNKTSQTKQIIIIGVIFTAIIWLLISILLFMPY